METPSLENPTSETPNSESEWLLWSASLSPFGLKLEALLRRANYRLRWLPRDGTGAEARRFEALRRGLISGKTDLTWPRKSDLDEFPQVPFLFGPAGECLYDSSAIGEWLAARPDASKEARALLPDSDLALRFAVRLIDEALDELGLYMVHHNRWVVAARDNTAGTILAQEMKPLLGPGAAALRLLFPARQVRRLPYLFSVAAPTATTWRDLPRRIRPPAKDGFPPTHALLEESFAELLVVLEELLATRPFLFGSAFTLADASVYGQLAMNMVDPSAHTWIARDAPRTEAWIQRILSGAVFTEDSETSTANSAERSASDVPVGLDAALAPLLDWVCRSFVPLMQQNMAAWQRHTDVGETLFNEKAFNRGRALYTGELRGHTFRSVVKTFQVRVWRDLRTEWDALGLADRARLETLLPSSHGLDRDTIPVQVDGAKI